MVDEEIFSRRLEALHNYLAKLKAFREADQAEFVREAALHDLAERYLHLVVEACLDLANHWIANEALPTPDTKLRISGSARRAGASRDRWLVACDRDALRTDPEAGGAQEQGWQVEYGHDALRVAEGRVREVAYIGGYELGPDRLVLAYRAAAWDRGDFDRAVAGFGLGSAVERYDGRQARLVFLRGGCCEIG
jgi:hypothetical protein